jgi:hypothetical protein
VSSTTATKGRQQSAKTDEHPRLKIAYFSPDFSCQSKNSQTNPLPRQSHNTHFSVVNDPHRL